MSGSWWPFFNLAMISAHLFGGGVSVIFLRRSEGWWSFLGGVGILKGLSPRRDDSYISRMRSTWPGVMHPSARRRAPAWMDAKRYDHLCGCVCVGRASVPCWYLEGVLLREGRVAGSRDGGTTSAAAAAAAAAATTSPGEQRRQQGPVHWWLLMCPPDGCWVLATPSSLRGLSAATAFSGLVACAEAAALSPLSSPLPPSCAATSGLSTSIPAPDRHTHRERMPTQWVDGWILCPLSPSFVGSCWFAHLLLRPPLPCPPPGRQPPSWSAWCSGSPPSHPPTNSGATTHACHPRQHPHPHPLLQLPQPILPQPQPHSHPPRQRPHPALAGLALLLLLLLLHFFVVRLRLLLLLLLGCWCWCGRWRVGPAGDLARACVESTHCATMAVGIFRHPTSHSERRYVPTSKTTLMGSAVGAVVWNRRRPSLGSRSLRPVFFLAGWEMAVVAFRSLNATPQICVWEICRTMCSRSPGQL